MTRTLLFCFLVGTFACSGDEEPVGASGSSGSSGTAGHAGSTAAGGAGGGVMPDGSGGTSTGGASESSDASDVSQERVPTDGGEASSEASPTDAFACPPQFDGGGKFPDVIRQGIWLIGWSGGLDHFSWVKFNFITDGGLNGLLLVKNAGVGNFFFPCEGNDGLFSVNPDNLQVVLQMPQSCADSGFIDTTIQFPFCYGPGGRPKGSLLHATFAQARAPNNIDGYMFPIDYCGANFTSCPNPFAPDQ